MSALVYKGGRAFCSIFTSVFFDLKVYGSGNVPREGGVLIVSNHQSYLDPVILGVRMRRPLSFLAKSELFESPAFGWLIRQLNAFPVRQGEGDVGAVKETIRRLREGNVLNLFPEGTRSLDGDMMPIQNGVGLIIRRAGVPVVPAAIHGSYEAWPKGSAIFHPHPIRAIFGKPMELENLKAAEIVQRVESSIRGLAARLRELGAKERAHG